MAFYSVFYKNGIHALSRLGVAFFFSFRFVTLAFGFESAPPRSESIRLDVLGGAPIQAQVRWIKSNARTRVPAILVFGGFEEAGKVLDLLHPDIPVALASFDYPYEGARSFHFPDTLLDASQFKRAVHRTTEGIGALARALAKDPRVDTKQIAVVGASFGAPFAVRAAAMTPEVSALILVHGFADVRGTMRARLTQLWRPRLGFWVQPATWFASSFVTAFLDPPEPRVDATQLKAGISVLMLEAEHDSFIPRESREILWEALKASPAAKRASGQGPPRVERQVLPGDHLMPGQEDVIRGLLARAVVWLQAGGWWSD